MNWQFNVTGSQEIASAVSLMTCGGKASWRHVNLSRSSVLILCFCVIASGSFTNNPVEETDDLFIYFSAVEDGTTRKSTA